MLFIDPVFIFLFLPVSLGVYLYFAARGHPKSALFWLVACSLYFYQSGNTSFLWVMLFSIAWNYAASLAINRPMADRLRLAATIVGIAGNLALLGYYKYYLFIVENLSFAFDYTFAAPDGIALPLGISFFTFQQITFLVDSYRGLERKNVLGYALFVSFFPQLIAGPIVHHHEMMPQFEKFRFKSWMIVQGFSFFAIGLFKKICIADSLAPFANGVFDSASYEPATALAAWTGTLAYTFQIYFDFSGYSDMAIGLARMFGIRLPINFNSPYRAENIIDFWRRWHITLSRFLRDYLYIPLGGNRLGPFRRHLNVMIVMLLGGIWHGAGWPFLLWGGAHGCLLVANHVWRRVAESAPVLSRVRQRRAWRIASMMATFLCVAIAWVPFRARTVEDALSIYKGMMGFNGSGFDVENIRAGFKSLDTLQVIIDRSLPNGLIPVTLLAATAVLYLSCVLLKNTQALLAYSPPETAADPPFKAGVSWAVGSGLLVAFSLYYSRGVGSEFIYWIF